MYVFKRSTPVIILAACTALATRLLWSPDRLPYSDDGLLHLFRTFALDRTIHAGVLYPRWLPDLGYGYGYPIFDFYPPLASYIVETIHLLGAAFALATNATFIAIVALAAGGAYALATEWFAGEREARTAGLLAAAAYIFFPYFIVNVYIRGALAEALAMALLPWVFWSLHRLMLRQTRGAFVIATVGLAALLLAHSITLVIAAPVLGMYVLWEWSRVGTPKRGRGMGLVVLAGL
ncbi:MAG TPA: 6-pyruvoyl-tetrahydropterin synthase-related protein, partial [Anaerolineae bacterium]